MGLMYASLELHNTLMQFACLIEINLSQSTTGAMSLGNDLQTPPPPRPTHGTVHREYGMVTPTSPTATFDNLINEINILLNEFIYLYIS